MHYDGLLGGVLPESDPIMKNITGGSIGINKKMSQLDIQKLNKMYPCKQISSACGKFFCTISESLSLIIIIMI